MATIGSLAVNITANTSGLAKGIQQTRSMISSFASKAALAGAGATAAIGGLLHMFESTGSQLHDLSEATGISVEKLSFLKYAAEQSGTGLEAITKAARELQSRGINPDTFTEIAASLAAIEDPTQRAAATFAKFGKKAGFPILALLKDLPKLKKRFKERGGGFTREMAEAADKMGDAWVDVKLALSNVGNQIASVLAPIVTDMARWVADNVAGIRTWVTQHQKLVRIVALSGLAFAALAPILVPLNAAIGLTATAVYGLNTACGFLAANPAVLVFGLIAASAAVAAYEIYQASDATKSWQDRFESFLNVVAPALPVLAKLFSLADLGRAAEPGIKVPSSSSPSLGVAPGTGATAAQSKDSAVAENTAKMVAILEKILNQSPDQGGQQPIVLSTAGVR